MVFDAFGKNGYIQSVVRDISEKKIQQDVLEHIATHDALTGAANRQLFFDQLEKGLARIRRNSSVAQFALVALIFIRSAF